MTASMCCGVTACKCYGVIACMCCSVTACMCCGVTACMDFGVTALRMCYGVTDFSWVDRETWMSRGILMGR